MSPEGRFWAKVAKANEGCWLWTASTRDDGYGSFGWKGRVSRAHRVSWEIANGPIPPGQWVLHRCDRPLCVRPDHLFLGTHSDNMKDRERKGRANRNPGPIRKISIEEAQEARRLYGMGVSQSELAVIYGMAQTSISALVRGESYRSVPR